MKTTLLLGAVAVLAACHQTSTTRPLKVVKTAPYPESKTAVRRLASPSAYALYLQAMLAREEGRDEDALQLLMEAYYYEAERAFLSYQIAAVFFALGDLDQTQDFLSQALQQEPELREARLLSARLLAAQGEHELAQQRFRELLPERDLTFWVEYLLLLQTTQPDALPEELATASGLLSPAEFVLLAEAVEEEAPALARRLFAQIATPRDPQGMLSYQIFLYRQQDREAAVQLLQQALADSTASVPLLLTALRFATKDEEQLALRWVEALSALDLSAEQEREECYLLATKTLEAGLRALSQALCTLLLSLDPSNEEVQQLSRKAMHKRSS